MYVISETFYIPVNVIIVLMMVWKQSGVTVKEGILSERVRGCLTTSSEVIFLGIFTKYTEDKYNFLG